MSTTTATVAPLPQGIDNTVLLMQRRETVKQINRLVCALAEEATKNGYTTLYFRRKQALDRMIEKVVKGQLAPLPKKLRGIL